MSQLIDRRQNSGKKSTVNRQRFLRRYKRQIKEAVSKAIGKRSITGIEHEEQITIPARDIAEPKFARGPGGKVKHILPGNDEFLEGDAVKRPPSEGGGEGGSGEASNQGEGSDDFVFELSREEFLDLYFEDLALPSLIRKEFAKMETPKTVRAGVTTSGVPTNLNIVRSMRQATGRRIALRGPYRRELKEIQKQLRALKKEAAPDEGQKAKLTERRDYLKRKLKSIPFLDTLDLRYNNRVKIPAPTTQAVMFCIMDVSGSMDEPKKDIAKRFFILLYLFLTKNYQKIELVFIRHHTSAKEVTEDEFFYSRETGGTVVSSALELLNDTITARFPPNAWNIYVAQASDGDNWNADSPHCQELLHDRIMPLLQYFAYVEIMPRHHQSLWEVYENLAKEFPNFCMESINNITEIYPVFRELFKRKTMA